MAKIFLTHSRHSLANYYGKNALAQLRTLGEVILNEGAEEPDEQQLITAARECDIIVSFRVPAITASVFDRLPKLIAVCRVAVDVRNIDIAAASGNGILVTQASPGFGASVAEWVIGVMINISRNISITSAAYWSGLPAPVLMGQELRGATLGVIGYGTIGQYLCRLASAFGMNVKVYDPYTQAQENGIANVSFDEVLTTADYLVCLAPATPETAKLINKRAFQKMKRSAFFINASRGELVDESDLLQALNDEAIAGCGLDVGSDGDQKPALSIASHPRVVASPHIAGLTPQAAEHQAMDTVSQVRDILAGKIPAGSLNAQHAWRWAK
ncbi:hydroxyacid dehydrogenase [Pollutimonas subterranea]|uniref:Hydroxyacid dehydrogenase n=1 Tax=Pollutimonas subterranea TaxID=2045210 RepID=A0A2N4TZP0_9BURK|nr:hydroxyacid dehydrogenase [Pollutimonas subterranea]PLC48227.1 hydroxyacid dehydrogenase [Pollutimonas subterranea]